MNLELKNIKHSEFASQETHCYEATLYIDGVRTAIVSNDGHGGCDNWHALPNKQGEPCPVNRAKLEEAIKWCEDNKRSKYDSLESRCCDMVNDWLYSKDAKRILRKICYINPDDNEIYSLPAKHKPTPENLDRLRASNWWRDDFLLLNAFDRDTAINMIVDNLKGH